MRGPKPKPTALRLIEGNLEHRPFNPDEPAAEGELSATPPPYLSPRAGYYWRFTVEAASWIKPSDQAVLETHCNARADQEEARAKVKELGAFIKFGKSGFQQNPWCWQLKAADAMVARTAAELGLTPSSRSRVKVKGKKKPNSILGKLRTLDL